MNVTKVCAKDLMQKDVKTVAEKTTVLAAAKMMRDCGLSSLVVERNNEHDALGIITRKDVVAALLAGDMGGGPELVGEIMTKPTITVSPDLSIENCLRMMRMTGVRRLPVVDGNKLVGILSNTDVFKCLAENIP